MFFDRLKNPCFRKGNRDFQSVKEVSPSYELFGIMGKKRTGGGRRMEQWQQDNRRDVVMVDIDQLVPKDHLLRKIEKVMDYD